MLVARFDETACIGVSSLVGDDIISSSIRLGEIAVSGRHVGVIKVTECSGCSLCREGLTLSIAIMSESGEKKDKVFLPNAHTIRPWRALCSFLVVSHTY